MLSRQIPDHHCPPAACNSTQQSIDWRRVQDALSEARKQAKEADDVPLLVNLVRGGHYDMMFYVVNSKPFGGLMFRRCAAEKK